MPVAFGLKTTSPVNNSVQSDILSEVTQTSPVVHSVFGLNIPALIFHSVRFYESPDATNISHVRPVFLHLRTLSVIQNSFNRFSFCDASKTFPVILTRFGFVTPSPIRNFGKTVDYTIIAESEDENF